MFVKNIINNIGSYLSGIDLCSFGTTSKIAKFLLKPYKLEFFFSEQGLDGSYYINLYNIHSNLILFKQDISFDLEAYLTKYPLIDKIVFRAGMSIESPTDTIRIAEQIDSLETDYSHMHFKFVDETIYFHFDRSDYIPPMYQETCKKTGKIVAIVDEQINVRKIITNRYLPHINNSKLAKYLKSSLYNKFDKYINKIVLGHTREIVCSNWTRIGKKTTFLVLEQQSTIHLNMSNLVGVKFPNFRLSEYMHGSQISNTANYLSISNYCGVLYSCLPKLPENLIILEINCRLTPRVFNILLKETQTLVHLKKVKLPFLGGSLKNLNKNIKSLALFGCNQISKIPIKRFDNLDYLEIELTNKNTLDLSNHQLRYLICKEIRDANIIFNNSIIYECIKLRDIEKNNIKNFKTKYLWLHPGKHIIIDILENVEAWKLEIGTNIKIICFPKNVVELKLESMELYSFSDFPDSLEKIYIDYIKLNRRYGVFPETLSELTINTIHSVQIYSHLPKSRNLVKFFSKSMDFPYGDVRCTFKTADLYYCTIYSQCTF